jgi:hypothetical protein
VTVHVDVERLLCLELLVAQGARNVSFLVHGMVLLQHVLTMELLVADLAGKLTLSCCA